MARPSKYSNILEGMEVGDELTFPHSDYTSISTILSKLKREKRLSYKRNRINRDEFKVTRVL